MLIILHHAIGLVISNMLLMVQLDDALSATRLPDGRIKLWIHVADPTCLVAPHSILDRFILVNLFFCLISNRIHMV